MSEAYESAPTYKTGESFARRMDDRDSLRAYRERFHLPKLPDGQDAIYFAGNSLGLQPKSVRSSVESVLDDWAALGVDGHFNGEVPWYTFHEFLREPGATLVGALPEEVVFMNGLTVNLHLMMVTFYRPTEERYKILMEDCAFPSDTYAVRSQIAFHGRSHDDALIIAKPREGENALRTDDLEALLEREGSKIALVLLGGVNYFTGQVIDMARLTETAHRQGCLVGLDLAHAAGNVELNLHDWNVDFAVWCTYKYLNSGPGAVAGCFVHQCHAQDTSLPRFGGWWGNDPKSRFRMHLEPEFNPVATADAWQLSNPPILSMAPVLASLRVFDEAGMAALRSKSEALTGYLQFLLDRASSAVEVITPRDPTARGCQLSILVRNLPKRRFKALQTAGVVCDFREPNVIRAAPVPLYNSFQDVWRFFRILSSLSCSPPGPPHFGNQDAD